jgi:hypothetical protein
MKILDSQVSGSSVQSRDILYTLFRDILYTSARAGQAWANLQSERWLALLRL